jgi:hypothetical protein
MAIGILMRITEKNDLLSFRQMPESISPYKRMDAEPSSALQSQTSKLFGQPLIQKNIL